MLSRGAEPALRWKVAQENELRYWIRKFSGKSQIAHEVEGFRRKAAEVENTLRQYIDLRRASVLQIGPAVIGEIHFLNCARRYAVDPLAHSFRLRFADLLEGVNYIGGTGEAIPLRDKSIDVVISVNLLDHVLGPLSVLREMSRILNNAGYVYLENHLYSPLAAGLRAMLDSIWRCTSIPVGDLKHPHSITEGELRRWLSTVGFEVLLEKCPTWKEARATFRATPRLKVKLLRGYGPFPVQNYMAVLKLGREANACGNQSR